MDRWAEVRSCGGYRRKREKGQVLSSDGSSRGQHFEEGSDRGHIPPREDAPAGQQDDVSADRGDRPFGDGFGGGSDWRRWLPLALLALVGVLFASQLFGGPPSGSEIEYSAFLDHVRDGRVASVTINNASGTAEGEFTEPVDGQTRFTTTAPVSSQEELLSALEENGVDTTFEPPDEGGALTLIIANILPLLLIGGLIWFFMRRARGQMSQITGIRQSKAEVIDAERPDTGFDDMAGYDQVKQEVKEVVDYLRDPSRYQELGARGPGGVLLVGPPGTGKTLLARAVAGEAKVPFISAAGSEFVEMLVGVGAARVRDLFEKARERAPSIIFIDELDSLGRKRGGRNTIGSNNEQEQTLNQLLSEMDGFDPTEGIVVMAATNRAEMLDEALTRPGRFDREIQVGPPKQEDRLKILELHTQGKEVAVDVDLQKVARGTPGFTGADLENLTNEAAMFAVRSRREQITQQDFDDARDRILLGRREDSSVLTDDERYRVAVHESGHAIVAASREEADPVSKVTILPAGKALGVTEQLPLNERRLYPESYLRARIDVAQGGRVAELLLLGEASSGAANDLAQATQIATRMIRDFGLSDELGPVGYASPERDGVPQALRNEPFSEQTQRDLDQAVRELLQSAEEGARQTLTEHRDQLEGLVNRLLEDDTVDGEVVYDMLGRPMPGRDEDTG